LSDPNVTTEIDYFRLLFPYRFMFDVIVPLTNAKLIALQQSPLLPPEFLTFLDITPSMALQPVRDGLDAYWSVTNEIRDTVYTPGIYNERFKMSKHLFKSIRRCLTLSTFIQTQPVPGMPAEPDADPWSTIRPFVDAFNATRTKVCDSWTCYYCR
jgi:hypothetical protein